MIQNYFKIGIRSLTKQKFYSLINITGLSVGVACCILIMMFVGHELSYDRYHDKVDRIYQLGFAGKFQGNEFAGATVGAPTGNIITTNYPEVETFVRFKQSGNIMMKKGDKSFREEKVLFADAPLFDVFSFDLIKGNPKTALAKPNTLVIDQSTARKYFGEEDPIGQSIIIDNEADYIVTGVMKDIPSRSHFRCNVFLAMVSRNEGNSNEWLKINFHTYLLLAEGANPQDLEVKFSQIVETYIGPELHQIMNVSIQEFNRQGNWIGFLLEPLTDIYLYSSLDGQLGVVGDIRYIYIFSAIALFILLIACINFMNLATACSASRSKEVGVRKILGSNRRQLITQFLAESILISIIAFVVALGLVIIALPVFNIISGKSLSIPLGSLYFLPVLGVSSILIGFLAGSYPAFYLSAFNATKVLKAPNLKGAKGSWLRSGLVIFQFTVSIILVVCTLVIYHQLNFIQQKKLGFTKEQVLLIDDMWLLGDQKQSMNDEVEKLPGVLNTTISQYLPVPSFRKGYVFHPQGKATSDNSFQIQNWKVDHSFISTMDMEIVKGRDFSVDFPSDFSSIILNERAVHDFGWDDPIGKKISRGSDEEPITYTIIGVVKDFNFQSLRENIGPLSFRLGDSPGFLAIRFQTKNVKELISKVETIWKNISNGQPFNYSFMDDKFNATYQTDKRVGNIVMIFAALAILVACLGLFALVTFTTEQRAREIGIRKVLGASVSSIVILLTKEFGKLIVISIVLAGPIAWYFMNGWLREFASRINLNIWVFFLVGGMVSIIAWLTISYQSIKASLANPIDSIKDE